MSSRYWIASLLIGGLSAVVLVRTAGADPLNRADYAAKCAAEMGKIPAFNCLDGELLPITVNGVAQSSPVLVCDQPVQLGLSTEGQCVPFARLVRLTPGDPDLETIAICRKYFSSTGPTDSRFDDIAMIQHKKSTGRTCFFQ